MNVQTITRPQSGLKALIFDMDDTMVKTMEQHFEAWVDLCLKHKPQNIQLNYSAGHSAQNLDAVKTAYSGCTAEEFVRILFGEMPNDKVNALAREREDLFIKQATDIQEIKGLTRFLETCNDLKRGIASSTSSVGIEHVLDKLNIKRFFKSEHIIDPSKTLRGKPSPDPYLAAAKALEVEPGNCLVCEDSRGGIQAAKSANMKVIGVATSISKPDLIQLGVSRAINDYTEIQNISELEELFRVMV